MLGHDRPHEAVPYFFSDLADWVSLEYVGPAATWDEEVLRGSLDDGDFTIFYLDDRRVVAALGVGPSASTRPRPPADRRRDTAHRPLRSRGRTEPDRR